MEIGVQLIFQSFGYPEGFSDQQVVDEEVLQQEGLIGK